MMRVFVETAQQTDYPVYGHLVTILQVCCTVI